MTTAKEIPFKELTVKQYEFYKRKGMTDERVMKIHGYNVVTLNAWKKKHDLIGVKFEKDVTVTEGKLLREKEIAPERLTSTSSVDSKPTEVIEKTVLKLADDAIEVTDKQVQRKEVEALKKAHNEDFEHPSTEWLEERHCKDTQTIDCLRYELKESERKRKLEAESSDTWRTKYRAADEELSKAKVKHDAEVRNLQYEITLLNKALEAHAGDEQLLLLTMKKAVSFAERVKVE